MRDTVIIFAAFEGQKLYIGKVSIGNTKSYLELRQLSQLLYVTVLFVASGAIKAEFYI